jgi:hypothetical protein
MKPKRQTRTCDRCGHVRFHRHFRKNGNVCADCRGLRYCIKCKNVMGCDSFPSDKDTCMSCAKGSKATTPTSFVQGGAPGLGRRTKLDWGRARDRGPSEPAGTPHLPGKARPRAPRRAGFTNAQGEILRKELKVIVDAAEIADDVSRSRRESIEIASGVRARRPKHPRQRSRGSRR